MFAKYLVAKAALVALMCAPRPDTVVFVGRLGVADREIWRLSSAADPICIARFPIQRIEWQSWEGLRIAVNPVRDEILVTSAVSSNLADKERNVWHTNLKLQLITFAGKRLASYAFDLWDPGRYGFGFTTDGHPFAAGRDTSDKIKFITLDKARTRDRIEEVGDLLEWKELVPRWAELSRPLISEGIEADIPSDSGKAAVELDRGAMRYKAGPALPRPAGVVAWVYGSRYGGGILLTALDASYRECKDWTRAMSIYVGDPVDAVYSKWFDGAYAVVARTGHENVRIIQ